MQNIICESASPTMRKHRLISLKTQTKHKFPSSSSKIAPTHPHSDGERNILWFSISAFSIIWARWEFCLQSPRTISLVTTLCSSIIWFSSAFPIVFMSLIRLSTSTYHSQVICFAFLAFHIISHTLLSPFRWNWKLLMSKCDGSTRRENRVRSNYPSCNYFFLRLSILSRT